MNSKITFGAVVSFEFVNNPDCYIYSEGLIKT